MSDQPKWKQRAARVWLYLLAMVGITCIPLGVWGWWMSASPWERRAQIGTLVIVGLVLGFFAITFWAIDTIGPQDPPPPHIDYDGIHHTHERG